MDVYACKKIFDQNSWNWANIGQKQQIKCGNIDLDNTPKQVFHWKCFLYNISGWKIIESTKVNNKHILLKLWDGLLCLGCCVLGSWTFEGLWFKLDGWSLGSFNFIKISP
jgi:hypothetical protein